MKFFRQAFFTVLVAALFSMATLPIQAFALDDDEPPPMETMTADLLMLKPLGFVATAVGCVLFTAALPFTVWSEKRINEAKKRFVVDPGAYTFVRPLGRDIHDKP
ncbi:MAG: multidrug transporter [Desulfobacteraceae bacterium]|nr:multidrug transporter [Desulfobacteraceae bacterium]